MTNREKLIELLTKDAEGETFEDTRYMIKLSPLGLKCISECSPYKRCENCYSKWLNEEAKE